MNIKYYPSAETKSLYYIEFYKDDWKLYQRSYFEDGQEAHPLWLLGQKHMPSISENWLKFMVDALNEKVLQSKLKEVTKDWKSGWEHQNNIDEQIFQKKNG